MARLKRERPEPRSRVIQLRVSESEARALEEAAAANGWTVADLIREALDRWLKRQKPKNTQGGERS